MGCEEQALDTGRGSFAGSDTEGLTEARTGGTRPDEQGIVTGTGRFVGSDTEELIEARTGDRTGREADRGSDSMVWEVRWSEQKGSIKETVCLRQSTYGLCSSSQERPRITGCDGE